MKWKWDIGAKTLQFTVQDSGVIPPADILRFVDSIVVKAIS